MGEETQEESEGGKLEKGNKEGDVKKEGEKNGRLEMKGSMGWGTLV